MNNKLNPNEAPPGYVAVAASGCNGCEIEDRLCIDVRCTKNLRKDRNSVIFIKRETEPLKPAPLDARLTIRLPASVKAKAQRIGAAAVIAAIEAVEEGGAA